MSENGETGSSSDTSSSAWAGIISEREMSNVRRAIDSFFIVKVLFLLGDKSLGRDSLLLDRRTQVASSACVQLF